MMMMMIVMKRADDCITKSQKEESNFVSVAKFFSLVFVVIFIYFLPFNDTLGLE